MRIEIDHNHIWDSRVNNFIWFPHTLAIEERLGEDIISLEGRDFHSVSLDVYDAYTRRVYAYTWKVPKHLREWLTNFYGVGDPVKADAEPTSFRFPSIERMIRYGSRIER